MSKITKEYIEENLLTKNGKLNSNKTKKIKETPEELYLIYHNLNTAPKCYCGNQLKFLSFSKGYNNFCSSDCVVNSEEVKEKRKQTFIKKFKTDNPFKSEEIKEKIKQTNIKKYGVDNPMKSDEIKNKSKNNMLEKYGVNSYFKTNEFQERIKEININKYGVLNHTQKNIKNISNYTPEFIENNFVINGNLKIKEMSEYFNISENHCYKILIKYNIQYKKLKTTSRVEQEILEFIGSGKQSDRSLIGKELDILVPEHKFAVEYNGLLWHSWNPYEFPTRNKKEYKNKHLEKSLLCESKGYQLFHIYDSEWLNPIKKEIWKSIINLKMDRGIRKINFNDCTYKIINEETKKSFLENNCLEGNIKSTINIGLYYGDELVQVLAYSDRSIICTKNNTKIDSDELLNYFRNKYKKEIILELDHRYYLKNTKLESPDAIYIKQDIKNGLFFEYKKYKENVLNEEKIFRDKYRRIYNVGKYILNL